MSADPPTRVAAVAPPNLVRGMPAEDVKASPSLPPREYGMLALIWSDYCRHYEYKAESSCRRVVLSFPRMFTNSSLHLTILTRLMQGTSPRLAWLWRRLMLTMHASDIAAHVVIGPGLLMPHPTGILMGPNTVIGRNAVIQHQVSIGPVTSNWRAANHAGTVQIGDYVTVFAGAYIIGEVTIGDGAVIGAKSLVIRDIPAGYAFNMRGGMRVATPQERDGNPAR